LTAIVRLRLAAYVRAYHAVAPLIAALVVLGTLYGGGVSRPEEAYGVSAIVMFPVLAWQAKILLDVEPDVQRRLVRVAAGTASREISAGLLAAAATGVPTILLALGLPWLVGGVGDAVYLKGQPAPLSLGAALAVGIWTHLLVVGPAVALGAWASRPVSRTIGGAVSVLTAGSVLAIVVGLSFSPIPWVAPPLMAVARATSDGLSAGQVLGLTGWALAWAGVAIVGYWRLRLRRI
jgi:hypothetical protein